MSEAPLEIMSPDSNSGPVSIDVAENVAVALKLEPIVETLQRCTQFKNPMLTYKTPESQCCEAAIHLPARKTGKVEPIELVG